MWPYQNNLLTSIFLNTSFIFAGVLIVLTQQYEWGACHEYKKIGKGLTDIPTDITEDVTEINLSSNRITLLKYNIFHKLSLCTEINLSNNDISEIEPGAFFGLTSLTWLSLGQNQLDQLSVNMFSGLVRWLVLYY